MAVLVNDFGAVNIDAELIVGVEGEDTVNCAIEAWRIPAIRSGRV